MRIDKFEVIPYSLKFREPFVTAHGILEKRDLVLVKMTSREGEIGWGEAAPLDQYDRVSVESVVRSLRARVAPALEGAALTNIEQAHASIASDVPAPARAAVDIAAHDLLAKGRRSALCETLGTVTRTRIPVNATITAEDPEAVAAAGRAFTADGFRTLKLKLGFPTDQARLEALRDAVGREIAIRVDANEAWGVEQAQACLAIISNYDIELVEQPVSRHNISGMHTVRSTSPIPIIADESVVDLDDLKKLNKANALDGVSVKLSPSGGIEPAARVLDEALRAGLVAFLTSTLDGPVGIAAALHLAAARGKLAHACGLATLDLFEDTIAEGIARPVDGTMGLPSGHGLGITINEDALAERTLSID